MQSIFLSKLLPGTSAASWARSQLARARAEPDEEPRQEQEPMGPVETMGPHGLMHTFRKALPISMYVGIYSYNDASVYCPDICLTSLSCNAS